MSRRKVALGLVLPVLGVTFFLLAVWDVGGHQMEWIGTGLITMVAGIPGIAYLAAEAGL